MGKPSDIDLMKRVRDEPSEIERDEAFKTLIQRHQNGLTHYLYRLTGSYDTALELAQETFLRVYSHRKSYEPTAAFSTWLYRIATNLGINETRLARNRYETCYQDTTRSETRIVDDWLLADTDGESPEDAASRDELRDRLEEHLEATPDDFRVAVLLKDLLGFSYEEISNVMGVALGTVKSRIHRGRRMIATSFKEEDPGTLEAYL